MKSCETNPLEWEGCLDTKFIQSQWEFIDGVCLKNGKVYGKIIYSDDKQITVEVDSENMYNKGMISTFTLVSK